jgi:hypothetical protein
MSPIKRELLINYPENWPELAAEIKAANHYICASCGVECRQDPSDRSKPVLTVAHVDQDYASPEIYVACLCAVCHLRMDAPFGMAHRRRNERWRRERAGQMTWAWAA